MIKKVPLAAAQAAIYKTLSEHIVGYNVFVVWSAIIVNVIANNMFR